MQGDLLQLTWLNVLVRLCENTFTHDICSKKMSNKMYVIYLREQIM